MKKTIFGSILMVLSMVLFLSPSFAAAQTVAAVTITTNSLGNQIPTDYLGFSCEWQFAQDFFGTASNPNNHFFQLMKNLGNPGVIRIGGNSTDEWCWDSGPSECQNTLNAGMINSIFNASAKTGYGVIAGVNLTDGSTTNAVDTVMAIVNDGINAYPGSKLVGYEIGNEPDLFDTSTNTHDETYPSSYTIGDNEADYIKFVKALNANATTKNVPYVGPAFAGGWSSQIGSWIGALQAGGIGTTYPMPALITQHNYPLSNCGTSTGTISGLLSASAMNSNVSARQGYVNQVAAKGLKLRMAEFNSSACGGTNGVSDVEAAALWAMDVMFRYAQIGVVGVNFHGGGTEDYSPILGASQGATVRPLYYGMLMFSNATGKYFLPTTVLTSSNITAYTVASSSSADPQVFVINKDLSASGLVTLKPSENMTSATLLVQSGSSNLSSTASAMNYGGVQPNTSTGVLPTPNTTTLTPDANGVFQFTLANASAAMITLHRGAIAPTPTPVVASTWRVNAGGSAYTDSQGNVWAADENFNGGTAAVTTNTITGALPGAADQTLYQSQRYGTSFNYVFNVPAGNYQVTLKFAETYFTAAASREFNVAINGTTELTNFDVFSAAGGQNKALDKVYNNISGAGGAITIAFGPSSVNNAVIQAIQIIPQPATATFTSTPTATLTPTQTPIVSTTSTFTSTPTSTPTLTPTYTFTSAATFTFTATPVVSGNHPPYTVVCYALQTTKAPANSVNDNGQGAAINWTTDVPWQDMTVVSDAFAIPATNDTFDMSETKNNALITPAHAHGVRCILSIGGGSQDGAFSTLCLPANRQAFASAVTALMMQYGYDGVDMDWEVDTKQQADATIMMQDVYTKIKALPNSTVDGKPRTLSFTTVDYISNIYNMTTLGNYTDWCFFMGYDWGACPELATGPLDAIASEIQSLTNGSQWAYPINKMILGCPLYCDHYTGTNCNAGEYDTLSILHLGTAGAYNSTWAEQAYTYAGGTVYVDTAQSYCDKTNWALNHGLLGVGAWDMAQALPYTDSAVSQIWNTLGGQNSCLNLGPTATPTKTATPVVASSWRVNAGGNQYTDSQGNVWAADENFTGGTAAVTTSTITGALPGTGDQTLYQSQRYGTSFSYTFNVPAGSYQVTLKFVETYFTAAASREFNVSINGTTELTNFDIFSAAGGQNKAIDKVYNNIAPSGGTITITFGPSAVNNAEIQAIQIIPMPATATNTPTLTATKTNTAANTATSTMTATNSPTLTNSPTVTSTFTNSPTATFTNTNTAANTATSTWTFSATPTWTGTPTATNSNTPGNTATSTWTGVFTSTPTDTSVVSPVATSTNTAVNTATNTAVNTATASLTPTWTFTSTPTNTNTAVNTATNTNTVVNTATNTNTAVNTATATSTFSFTPTWTGTATWTASFTATAVRTSTSTPSFTPTATWTGTPTATRTFTSTPTKTATPAGACAGIPLWNGDSVGYSIGAKVQYNGEEYQCIQAHTSLSTWMPSVTPALWKDLGSCNGTAPKALVSQPAPVVYPNPATGDTTTIGFSSVTDSNVSVKIYTVAMRLVQTINFGQVNSGNVTVRLIDKSGVKLADGLYYFQVQANGASYTLKVLVLR